MPTLTLTSRIDADGHLRLDVPTDLPSGEVELMLVIEPVTKDSRGAGKRYDFSDLSGKLQWQGDPVAAQRALRDEWP